MNTDPALPKTFTDIELDPTSWPGPPSGDLLAAMVLCVLPVMIAFGVAGACSLFVAPLIRHRRAGAKAASYITVIAAGVLLYVLAAPVLRTVIGPDPGGPAGQAPRDVAAEVFDAYYPGGDLFGPVEADSSSRTITFTAADQDHTSYECTISAPPAAAAWMTCLPQVQGAARR